MPDLLLCTAVPPGLQAAYARLLTGAGLRLEEAGECTALLLADDGALLACGTRSGKVLRQIAVSPEAEGGGACAEVVSALLQDATAHGVPHPFLFTAPGKSGLFRSLGFTPLAQTADMLMMEHRRGAWSGTSPPFRRMTAKAGPWCATPIPSPGATGTWWNMPPPAVPHLYVFVLSEETGDFPAADRLELVRRGTADLPNVDVVPRRGLYHLPGHLPRLFPPGGPGAGPVRPGADPVRKAHRPGPGHHPAVRGPGALLPGDGPV